MPDPRGPTLDFVTTPTESWLRESLKDCRSRLLVASPYVNEAFSQVLRSIPPSIKTTLVTKTDLRDFAMGSSNLETLYTLARQGVRVMSLHALHAKVYVLDRRRALITSANATWSGMRRNLECGVAIDQQAAVGRVARLVLSGFGADSPPKPTPPFLSLAPTKNFFRGPWPFPSPLPGHAATGYRHEDPRFLDLLRFNRRRVAVQQRQVRALA